MKLNRFFNISASAALVIGMSACSSDYLDLKPEGTLEYQEVLTNAQGAELAIMGMCNAMSKQYSSVSDGSLGFNGEASMLMFYGEAPGVDYVSTFWMMYGGQTLLNWDTEESSGLMNSPGGSQPAWSYCYGLISQANNLLTFTPKQLDEAGKDVEEEFGIGQYTAFNPVPDFNLDPQSSENQIDYAFRYAQALTFRAHAYIHLMQIYCARWEERYAADGNWSLTVPLRLRYQSPESDLNCPLATWEELVNQIYADLSQALALYDATSSYVRRTYEWEPDEDVAKGLFSRIAMINHDWETARTMASEARKDYPLMSVEDYLKGFAAPNSEWMWTNSGEFNGLYFWSFGATYACNGAYPTRWGTIGAGGMNNDLLASANARDQRASLYFGPRAVLGNAKALFWSNDNCNSQTMNINGNNGDLHREFVNFCTNKSRNVAEFGWLPPYTYYGAPLSVDYTTCAATFGAQFKFWGSDVYSSSHFPFMRASELLLTEAEAAYMLGDEKAADDLLTELNVLRYSTRSNGQTYYSESYSGEELYAAIKKFRRLELWGEGFHWFDAKRWYEPIERRAWTENDQNSGNWPSMYAKKFDVRASNGWRWRIPTVELNYNSAIDRVQASYGYNW